MGPFVIEKIIFQKGNKVTKTARKKMCTISRDLEQSDVGGIEEDEIDEEEVDKIYKNQVKMQGNKKEAK